LHTDKRIKKYRGEIKNNSGGNKGRSNNFKKERSAAVYRGMRRKRERRKRERGTMTLNIGGKKSWSVELKEK